MSAASITATALAFARQRAADAATAARTAQEYADTAPPRIGRFPVMHAVVLHDRHGLGLLPDTNPWSLGRLLDLCPAVARGWGFDPSGALCFVEDRTPYQCAGTEARPGCRDEVDLYVVGGVVGVAQ